MFCILVGILEFIAVGTDNDQIDRIGKWFRLGELSSFTDKIPDVMELVPLMGIVFFWTWLLGKLEKCIFRRSSKDRNRLRKIGMLLNYYVPMYWIFLRVLYNSTREYLLRGQCDSYGFLYFRLHDFGSFFFHADGQPCGICSVEKNFTASLLHQVFKKTLDQANGLVDMTEIRNGECTDYCNVFNNNHLNDTHASTESCLSSLSKFGFDNWLKYFVLVPPLFVWASVAICLYLTLWHIISLMRAKIYNEDFWARHQVVMWIIALPTVYGILSFKAMERCLQVAYDFEHTEELANQQWKFYNADFAVGDLYEALALLWFGNLTFGRITQEHDRVMSDMDRSVLKHTESQQIWAKELVERGQSLYEPMAASTSSLLTTCVFGFIFSCIADASIAIADLGLFIYMKGENYQALEPTMQKAENFMLGFGFVTSSMAIYGVIRIEVAFHDVLHELNFHAWWKFLSCKLLVSLAFLQQIICFFPLPGLGPRPGEEDAPRMRMRLLTVVESNFLYAACLSMESLLVSLICLKAWRSEENWYTDGIENLDFEGAGHSSSPSRQQSSASSNGVQGVNAVKFASDSASATTANSLEPVPEESTSGYVHRYISERFTYVSESLGFPLLQSSEPPCADDAGSEISDGSRPPTRQKTCAIKRGTLFQHLGAPHRLKVTYQTIVHEFEHFSDKLKSKFDS